FAKTLGRPELAEDPKFTTAHARRDNNAEIVAIVEEWLRQFPTRDAAIAALERDRIPCGPVLTLNEAMRLPHLIERGTVRQVSDSQIGSFAIPGNPVRFSDWKAPTDVKADMLGESNEVVLKEFGLSRAEINDLYADKVLVRDPLLDRQ